MTAIEGVSKAKVKRSASWPSCASRIQRSSAVRYSTPPGRPHRVEWPVEEDGCVAICEPGLDACRSARGCRSRSSTATAAMTSTQPSRCLSLSEEQRGDHCREDGEACAVVAVAVPREMNCSLPGQAWPPRANSAPRLAVGSLIQRRAQRRLRRQTRRAARRHAHGPVGRLGPSRP